MEPEVKRGPRCPACGSEAFGRIYSGLERNGRAYGVYYCPGCRTAVTHPFPDTAELDRLYSADTYRAHDRRFVFPVEWAVRCFRQRRIRCVEKFARRGRILDIGCARGYFLSTARELGWEAFGLEYNDETASQARDVLGFDVRTGGMEEAGFEVGYFDAITIWHVLEHLPDPVKTLQECWRALKPGGLLAVAVPNFESLQSSISREHWFHLDVPYHMHHFSLAALRGLLEGRSFEVLRVGQFSLEFNPFGFLQSFYNMAGMRHNCLYDIAKSGKLKGRPASPCYRDILLMMLSMPVVLPVSAALSVFEAAVGRGGTVEVYARKGER
jgi:2-polyprenyl-3-methyl-5-hydroxy-6-metoxy-1,4-benzoquinol methylase